jgi:hypothetical protein
MIIMIVFGSLTAAMGKKKQQPDFFMYTIMVLYKKKFNKNQMTWKPPVLGSISVPLKKSKNQLLDPYPWLSKIKNRFFDIYNHGSKVNFKHQVTVIRVIRKIRKTRH